MENFIEANTKDEANKVDLDIYWWSERMSSKIGKYVFVKREKKQNKQ